MICVLAGGVGAARFLRGLIQVVPPAEVTAVVNVADDMVLSGLHISPDLDTVTYTLAGVNDTERGWGLAGETWHALEALRRFDPDAWFSLGDRDLGTHLYRTGRLAAGATLSEATAGICAGFGLEVSVLPVTDDPLRTRVTLATDDGAAGEEVDFQDYFVRRRHDVAVHSLRFDGADVARPAPGVLAALDAAEVIVVAPSNPLVSIDPVLAVPGVRQALTERRADVVAVSPIVAGRALKGPADRLLRELGHDPSAIGVARHYAEVAATLVIDEADADRAADVEAAGMRCVVAPTVMSTPERAAALAARTIESGRGHQAAGS
ncbi:MAG: 2-phospho-L-lactate transferase [Acidimicrobiia bacterium]|nr:2-phospho-L-lactate transferase [Acidimicrobiia bacterium]